MFYHQWKEMEEAIESRSEKIRKRRLCRRRRIASENTWDQRVKSIVEIFNNYLDKK